MRFKGWPAEALDFYEGLEADNSKAYWTEHKQTYEDVVRAPMAALLAELEEEWGEGKIFRPYRDVRFSHDKSPYKTSISATIGSAGYVTLSVDGLGVGSGMYMMSTDQLARYRAAVGDDRSGPQLQKAIAAGAKRGVEMRGHEELKTVPRGYPKEHPRADLLRNKGLIAWRSFAVEPWLGTAAAKARVVQFLRDARPLNDWLDANVGPAF